MKPAYPAPVAYGNVQPFYNTQHSQASPYASFFQQQQVAPSYYVSQPQALSPKPIMKVPNYALGYKGLGHYASSSPAPISEHTGLSNFAAVYQQPSAPVVSYSHSLKHPQKYNQVHHPSAYIQQQSSYRGTNQKPFRASPYLGVNSVNGQHNYDSYGEQTITNEKPAHTYLPANEVAHYQTPKEYLSVKGFEVPAQEYLTVKGFNVPSKEYLPVKDQTTEHHQYSTEVIPHSTERPTNYLNPTKSFLQPYQNQYLPTTTENPKNNGEAAVYFSKDTYPSTQNVPQYTQQYTPQAQYYQYTAQQQENSAPDYQNKDYYTYSNQEQQQPQFVQFVPEDATVPIQK